VLYFWIGPLWAGKGGKEQKMRIVLKQSANRIIAVHSLACPRAGNQKFKAGLLASGLTIKPGLPVFIQWLTLFQACWLISPVTAAGPQRSCTVFPFKVLANYLDAATIVRVRGESQ